MMAVFTNKHALDLASLKLQLPFHVSSNVSSQLQMVGGDMCMTHVMMRGHGFLKHIDYIEY